MKDYIKPVAIMAAVSFIVGLLMSAINNITAPLIKANEEAEKNRTYFAALPDAGSFTELECGIEGVTAVQKAGNGEGYVITAQSRGYGGQVPAAVAFSNDGSIIRVIMMSNEETPGLGQKVTDEAFSSQFDGIPVEAFTLDDIDAIAGATISSRAAVKAINLAIEAYTEVTAG